MQTPYSFCSSVVVVGFVIFGLMRWHYSGIISTQSENIHYLTQQRDDARADLEKLKAYKEMYGLPLKRKALIFADQVHELRQDWQDTDSPQVKYHHIEKYLYQFSNAAMWITEDLADHGKRSDELWKMMHKLRWTPKTGPQVKMDFRRSAVDKKERTYESKT